LSFVFAVIIEHHETRLTFEECGRRRGRSAVKVREERNAGCAAAGGTYERSSTQSVTAAESAAASQTHIATAFQTDRSTTKAVKFCQICASRKQ